MKKFIQLFLVLLMFGFLASCKGTIQSNQSKGNTNNVQGALSTANAKDNTSPYGPTTISRKMILDQNGHLLIASYEGIIRYDGNSFTNITKAAGLDSCYAFDVLEDPKGDIWIASNKVGAFQFDGTSFTHFTTDEGLIYNRVITLYQDKAEHIWFASMNGVSRYNHKTFTNFTTNEGLPYNDVTIILEDKTGKFWFGSRDDAFVYDGTTFTVVTNNDGETFNGIVSIIEDQNGNIWLGGKNGLWRYNGTVFSQISTIGIHCVYEDPKGNIWTTHETNDFNNGALSRYDENTLSNKKPVANKILEEPGMFFGIQEDNEGKIWIGTLSGVICYDGRTINHFKEPLAQE